MTKNIINTEQAPAAIGPYSQAVEVEGALYVSGQIPINSGSGEIIKGNIQKQVRQVLENVKSILESAGYELTEVVKAEVFVTDIDEFALVNEIYAEYFQEDSPARACVEVASLPKGVDVEISVIAVK